MKSIYEQNCRIDEYSDTINTSDTSDSSDTNYFFACGKQFICGKELLEKMPYSADDICITADCVIDNRVELIEANFTENDLTGASSSISDSQLIYVLYTKYGQNFVSKLRGLFSIAIYDKSKATAYLYTDPVSARSLYYYVCWDTHTLTFSTLIGPIISLCPQIEKDQLYIKDYLLAPGLKPNMEAGLTAYKDLRQVLPGSCVTIKQEGQALRVCEEKYFKIAPLQGISYRNAKTVGAEFRKIYEACVEDAIRTDGQVAVAMSSGLDSASIAALAADRLKKANRELYTFTYVPENRPDRIRVRNVVMDETEDVKKILAMHPNMKSQFLCNEGKNCYKFLEQDLAVMEFPIKAYVNFPNLFEIYESAREKGCKVVLTGQTGNGSVSFGYIDDVLFDLYEHRRYLTMFSFLNRYSKTVRESRKKAFRSCVGLFRHSCNRKKDDRAELRSYHPTNEFLSEKITENYDLEGRFHQAGMKYFDYMPTDREEFRKQYFCDELFAYIGAMETKMGLYSGTIIRDATKDVRMLSFCYFLPFKYFAYKGTPRWLIRNNLRDVLPNDLLDDWMRYGLQNVDCFDRIRRDWDEVSNKAISIIDSCKNNERACQKVRGLINLEKLRQFFETKFEEDDRWELQFDNATYALMIILFFQK